MKHLIEFKNTAFYTFAAMLLAAAIPSIASTNAVASGADDSQFHVVDKGEILWCIAHHTYGDPRAYIDIHLANPELIDPDMIEVGDRLALPDVARQFDGRLPQSATSCCSGTYFKNTPECRHRDKSLEYAKPAFSITTDERGAIKAVQQNNRSQSVRPGDTEIPHQPVAGLRNRGDAQPEERNSTALLNVSQSYQFVIDGNENPAIIQIPNDQPYYGVSHE